VRTLARPSRSLVWERARDEPRPHRPVRRRGDVGLAPRGLDPRRRPGDPAAGRPRRARDAEPRRAPLAARRTVAPRAHRRRSPRSCVSSAGIPTPRRRTGSRRWRRSTSRPILREHRFLPTLARDLRPDRGRGAPRLRVRTARTRRAAIDSRAALSDPPPVRRSLRPFSPCRSPGRSAAGFALLHSGWRSRR
jgi:hypothetical protein